MSVETRTEAVRTLEKARGELQAMSRASESEIESVARAFEGLAGHADTILNLAAAIVGCVENESVSSVLPKVQTLGATARGFIGDRLQATTGILGDGDDGSETAASTISGNARPGGDCS